MRSHWLLPDTEISWPGAGVGKERILAAVRQRCGMRLAVEERKLGVMACLDLAGEPLWLCDQRARHCTS